MQNIKIKYISESDGNIKGEYIDYGPNKYTIYIYGASSFADTDKQVLSHEFLHSFTKYKGENMAYGVGLAEIVNVVLNNEYFGAKYSNVIDNDYFGTLSLGVNPNEYDKSYHWSRRYAYLLTELVGDKVMRQYHATANPSILESALMEIYPDKVKAQNITIGLDFHVWNYTNNIGKKMFEEIMSDVDTDLKFFYEIKFNKQLDDDNYASFLLNTDGFKKRIQEEYSITNLDYFTTETVKEKKYFNSVLKDEAFIINFSYPIYTSCSEIDIISKYPEYLDKVKELPKDDNGNYIISEIANVSYDLYEEHINQLER